MRATDGDSQLFIPLVRRKSHLRVERITLDADNLTPFSSAVYVASEAETQ